MKMTTRILVTGACGQLGAELITHLNKRYGTRNIIASDLRTPHSQNENPFELLDVTNADQLNRIISKHQITQIYHLAAILSDKGEQNPQTAWRINMDGLLNVLEAGRKCKLDKIYWPSSIAVFGSNSPKNPTPQYTVIEPETAYGISKHAGELWCKYYHAQYGLDIRSLRYPGLIGHKGKPGGGTTDYAVDIFHKAAAGERFQCFLAKDTTLPMMYMPDAIKATLNLMEADAQNITVRTSYNIQGMSFNPVGIYQEIKKYEPDFSIIYQPDFRQEIADSWPKVIDDTKAKNDWDWQPVFTLQTMVKDMLHHLKKQRSPALVSKP